MNGKPQQAQQQPQKCPRCDSLNTKFCYYNNYSLSQPRYFCKACRRYWTQGGTLRNVRVGGGCRKPKRSKGSGSSSSASSASSLSAADTGSAPLLLPPPREAPEVVLKDPSAASSASAAAAVPSVSPFYQGGTCGVDDGGYLSSLAAIQSPFNQMGSCSNLSLLSGFGAPVRPPSQPFFQMGVIREKEGENLQYEAERVLIQPTTAETGSAATHHDWTESFIHNVNHRGSDASLWSTTMSITSSTSGNSESHHNETVGGSFSLIPNHQWPDLPEYDPPPPPP